MVLKERYTENGAMMQDAERGEVAAREQLWMAYRQAQLVAIDAIERYLGLEPTTASLRRRVKAQRSGDDGGQDSDNYN